MFFYISKIVWFLLQPLGIVFMLFMITAICTVFAYRRSAVFFSLTGMMIVALTAWTNIGQLMLSPLEERFVRPDHPPDDIAGIIVLGGGMAGRVNLVRGGYELEDAGDRFVEAAILARRYPEVRIVISGGSGALIAEGEGDAATARRLLTDLGIDAGRLVLENTSRNTAENAIFTRQLVNPRQGETWLLVTSAFHMPRSMALFRQAGFRVMAWPTDYRTPGPQGFSTGGRSPVNAMEETTLALREWTGLAAYYLTGRIPQMFPSP